MSDFVFKLPDIGEGIAEAEIVKWHVQAGAAVSEGQPLVDVMTDKATVEIAAPVAGTVMAIRGSEGSKLPVGAELAVIEIAGEALPPAVLPSPVAAPANEAPASASPPHAAAKALAAPAVRARARALGIDLATVAGTGPEGRVEHSDLDRHIAAKAPPSSPIAVLAPAEEGSEDIRIFGLRRRIAERVQEAKRRAPHVTYVEEVDVTDLETLRTSLNRDTGGRPHLTVLPLVVRAIVIAAPSHPAINSQFDDAHDIVRQFRSVHLGVATHTERGLLVPVIRHAERMDVWQLSAEIGRVSEAARAGKSDRQELSGSTITVTSLGVLGGVMATPILNLPEVAIVGVNRIVERPAIVGGAVVARQMMNLSSSFDHRIIDGHVAASFIADVRKHLESPERLSLPVAS